MSEALWTVRFEEDNISDHFAYSGLIREGLHSTHNSRFWQALKQLQFLTLSGKLNEHRGLYKSDWLLGD
jgi:hypothetical protein